MSHIAVFLLAFVGMEWAAWAMHKYVMHGFLWNLHHDHHVIDKSRWWQWNDFFAIFFAVPSFFSILLGSYFFDPHLASFGYGIMAYGLAYFLVHEVLIHRRLRFINWQNWYARALIKAHREHHQLRTKEGCNNFGMLWVSPKYFIAEMKKSTDRVG